MADLAHVLRHLPPSVDPNLLVGNNIADDAAVYRLSDELALVQTVDFFTPIVDDPYTYGQIAAANSLSDVYAMGGTPLTALNVVGFPVSKLDASILAEILRGGSDKAREANVTIVGGHTVDDGEPKYGMAVTGTVHPSRYMTSHGAMSGDLLVLTKPIGTGVVATALKGQTARSADVKHAVRWMTQLNRAAAEAMMAAGAHAATDVTGFGLLGHLSDMAKASNGAARVFAPRVPILPGALDYARMGSVPGGTAANLSALKGRVSFDPALDDVDRHLLADPQTSGGLLIALPSDNVPAFMSAGTGVALSAVIGEVVEGEPGAVHVLS